jgi:hypothetical protein
MFGSIVLEVAIGVVFVYLLLSLIVSAVTELLSGLLKWRAQNLRVGIRNLLDSGAAEEWVKKIYDHPLIQSLCPPSKPGATKKGPSYIPSRTFAVALVETLQDGEPAGRLAIKAVERVLATTPDSASLTALQADLRAAVKNLPDSGAAGALKGELGSLVDRVPATVSLVDAKKAVRGWLDDLPDRWLEMLIDDLPDGKLKGSLTSLIDESKRGAQHFKENVETWFNQAMDRVSGWYKRKTQAVQILLAVVVTVGINVDSVLIVNALSQNEALRQSIVAEAEVYAQQAAKTEPVGRPAPPVPSPAEQTPAPAAGEAPAAGQAPAASSSSPLDSVERLQAQLAQLDLPIGWNLPGQRGFDPANHNYRGWPGWKMYGSWSDWLMLWVQTVRFHLLGWLLTALAISLGAPFWFDMLNKLINIRSSGRAPEEAKK